MNELEKFFKIVKLDNNKNRMINSDEVENVKYVIPYNSKILTKEEFNLIINSTNKVNSNISNKRSFSDLETSNKDNLQQSHKAVNKYPNPLNNVLRKSNNSSSNVPKPVIKTVIDREKKQYLTQSQSKLEEELAALKQTLKEIKETQTNEKIKQEVAKYEKLRLKWKKISQEAIFSIIELVPHTTDYKKNTVKSVIESLRIDKESIEYDSENECFYD